jgi:hypothetical protein
MSFFALNFKTSSGPIGIDEGQTMRFKIGPKKPFESCQHQ